MAHEVVHRVGDATITKIPELSFEGIPAGSLFPDSNPIDVEQGMRKLHLTSEIGQPNLLPLSVHAWLVRTPERVVLVDAGSGNDKARPRSPTFDHLNGSFLARLEAAGAYPEEIDLVLHTHLHVDHVGWNTRRVEERWVPTFPNAKHVYSARERAYLAALWEGRAEADAIRTEARLGTMASVPDFDFYGDSISPLIDAGLSLEVAVDDAFIDGFSYLPSPGHSIDHACISLTSRGERALFWGDIMHHPIQFEHLEWNSIYCEFPDAARHARRSMVSHAAETGSLVFTSHFVESSVGRVFREGDVFGWGFHQGEVV